MEPATDEPNPVSDELAAQIPPEEKERIEGFVYDSISVFVQKWVERNNRLADWLLLITGGAFAALLSSGLKPPISWETKVLVSFLLISSIIGIWAWFLRMRHSLDRTLLSLDAEFDKLKNRPEETIQDQKSRGFAALYTVFLFLHSAIALSKEIGDKKAVKKTKALLTDLHRRIDERIRNPALKVTHGYPNQTVVGIGKRAFLIERLVTIQTVILFAGLAFYALLLLIKVS